MSAAAQQFCIACAHDIAPGAIFCTACGHEVGAQPGESELPPLANYHAPGTCEFCGGDGSRLALERDYCPYCRWLRPISEDYELPLEAFMWQMDAQAMAVLNGLGPLSSAAHNIAEKYGRPVFEAATNGIRLSEQQMPELVETAKKAARLMALSHLPEIYVSGQRMWDVYSLGGFSGSFISIGSVLVNFKPDDLLFLIAREMGHVRAGHVYWNTAMQFLTGKGGRQPTILGEGVLQFLNPSKLVESAIDAPMMRWARHSEITADRAATLVTGDLDCARSVLTQWAMKSFPITGKLNKEAWLAQEAAADDPYLQLSEWTMSTTPYLAPRLKSLAEYHASESYGEWREYIGYRSRAAGLDVDTAENKEQPGSERLTCAACNRPMRVPTEVLAGDKPVNVRCPNSGCRKVNRVKPKRAAKSGAARGKDKARIVCISCEEPMYVDRASLQGDEPVNVRCPNKACGEVLSIKPKPAADRPDLLSD